MYLIDIEDDAHSWTHLVEAPPDATALLDECGVMRCVNELRTVLTGFHTEVLVDRNVQMLAPPRQRNVRSRARGQYVRDPKARLIWRDRDPRVRCRDASELSFDFALTRLALDAMALVGGFDTA
jgi:PAS domain S-box-containing protein